MENEKFVAIENDLILRVQNNLTEAFIEYLRDENSSEAYYALENSLSLVFAFKNLLKRHFSESNLQSRFAEIKVEVLKSANDYCEQMGEELTQEQMQQLDNWLK